MIVISLRDKKESYEKCLKKEYMLSVTIKIGKDQFGNVISFGKAKPSFDQVREALRMLNENLSNQIN